MKKPYEHLPIPGFCDRRNEQVTEWACKACFWGDADLRAEHQYASGSSRVSCVARHIEAPRLRTEREAQVVRLQPMLDRMDVGGWQGIVRNVLEAALAHPEEETAKNLLRQIEAHAEHAVEEPPDPCEPGPSCGRCGAVAEWDDSVCECGGFIT